MTNKSRAVFLLAFVILAAMACGNKKDTPIAQAPQDTAESAEDRIVLEVSQAVRKAHMTNLADTCLAYSLDNTSSKDAGLVEVRENHRDPSCNGDPNTQPRLFTVKVDKHTHEMTTDARTPDRYHSLGR